MMHKSMMGRGVEIKDTNPKKLTFKEWWDIYGCNFWLEKESAWQLAEYAWKSSKENS